MILIVADIFLNSFSLSFQSSYKTNYYFIVKESSFSRSNSWLPPLMVLILLWQTFPLRHGFLSTLIKEFKWTFIMLLAFLSTDDLI